eukprot:scaffold1010_cov334-Prasinococcus_capsulatus_cf.AAC.7
MRLVRTAHYLGAPRALCASARTAPSPSPPSSSGTDTHAGGAHSSAAWPRPGAVCPSARGTSPECRHRRRRRHTRAAGEAATTRWRSIAAVSAAAAAAAAEPAADMRHIAPRPPCGPAGRNGPGPGGRGGRGVIIRVRGSVLRVATRGPPLAVVDGSRMLTWDDPTRLPPDPVRVRRGRHPNAAV